MGRFTGRSFCIRTRFALIKEKGGIEGRSSSTLTERRREKRPSSLHGKHLAREKEIYMRLEVEYGLSFIEVVAQGGGNEDILLGLPIALVRRTGGGT